MWNFVRWTEMTSRTEKSTALWTKMVEDQDIILSEIDTGAKDKRSPTKIKKYPPPRPKSEKMTAVDGITDRTNSERPQRRRFFNRTRSAQVTKENEDPGNKENDVMQTMRKRPRTFRRNSRRPQVDFSLVVSNIDKNVRVRHLKDALIDHGIKPNNITWRGYKGFCYLHYVKPVKEVEEKPFAVDNVIEILQTLKLNSEPSNNLSVKIMEPITRIETTDVTAV